MEDNRIKLTREELYERVWSTPATKLSKEFGISDVVLGKICKKLNIPKPYPGYWQQLAAGRRVHKEKLPPIKQGVPEVTYIYPHQGSVAKIILEHCKVASDSFSGDDLKERSNELRLTNRIASC